MLPPFYIMAKPVCGVCNLKCAYCYYIDKPRQLYPEERTFMMSADVLERYTREYLAAQPVQANFGWQGGEPLLAGKAFFQQAVEFQQQYGVAGGAAGPGTGATAGAVSRRARQDAGETPATLTGETPVVPGAQVVANALQTNGTLLDDEWCELLARYKFLVGLSLDGPPDWHDFYRRDAAGQGSFARAWAGLELLRKHRVEFNLLVTLNARNAPHAGDLYRYFVNRGIHWLQFIPVLEKDAAGRPTEHSCTGEQFGRFMLDVLALWLERHVGMVSERLIDSVLHTIVHGRAALCCNAESCANAYVLEWNGDLYACDHFVYRHWLIGNIMRTPLEDLVRSPKLEEFARLKTELPAACRDCEFLAYCRGGCPKHHVVGGPPACGTAAPGCAPSTSPAEGGWATPDCDITAGGRPDPRRVNHFCTGYKLFFRHALPELKRIAEYLKRGQQPPPGSRPPGPSPQGHAPTPMSDQMPPSPYQGMEPPRQAVQAGRNTLCPCGSGRKFKHCCGR